MVMQIFYRCFGVTVILGIRAEWLDQDCVGVGLYSESPWSRYSREDGIMQRYWYRNQVGGHRCS